MGRARRRRRLTLRRNANCHRSPENDFYIIKVHSKQHYESYFPKLFPSTTLVYIELLGWTRKVVGHRRPISNSSWRWSQRKQGGYYGSKEEPLAFLSDCTPDDLEFRGRLKQLSAIIHV